MWKAILEKLTALDRINAELNSVSATPGNGSVFTDLCRAFRLRAVITDADRARIPRGGPVIYVSNHPAGFPEGLVIPALLDGVRSDVAVMAHSWFEQWPALADRMFLVDPQAPGRRNAAALKKAVRWLRNGGALFMTPSGEVAHGALGSFQPREPGWRMGLATLVRLSKATVVPIHFAATNRRRFQVLSWINPRLGILLLCRELLAHKDDGFRVRVGRPLPAVELLAAGNPQALVEKCRRVTMILDEDSKAAAGKAGNTRIEKACPIR